MGLIKKKKNIKTGTIKKINEQFKKRGSKNRRRGKANQSKQAQMLGVCNVGGLGGEDGMDSTFSCEFKNYQKSAAHNMMEQCIKNNKDSKIPLLMIHKKGDRRDNDLICFRYKDRNKVCKEGLFNEPRKPVKREKK